MKTIFIDADGTLYHHEGYIPDSARQAVYRAQEKGHRIILATGRACCELDDALRSIPYDGMICTSGSYIQMGDTVLLDTGFSKEQLQFLMEYEQANDQLFIYESNQGLICSQEVKKAVKQMIADQCADLGKEEYRAHGLVKMDRQLMVDSPASHIIKIINFLPTPLGYQRVKHDLEDQFDLVPSTFEPLGRESGEIMNRDYSKGTAVQLIRNTYRIAKQDVIAIGDGFNDLPMFEEAGISVAMGNADPKVQKKATFTAPSFEEDGLSVAFQQLSLL
ncbi:MAG: HAD family hydrolase [Erysipelotrichaceae bacterium]|nr:HAD family hydrolase [Erysipelotrichaceae bacterium]